MSYLELWNANEVEEMISKGALIVDVRKRDSFSKEHIKGSINIPLEELDSHVEELPRDKPIIVYCGSVECTRSYFAARKLANLGFKVYRYTPGLKGWKEAGLPTGSLEVE